MKQNFDRVFWLWVGLIALSFVTLIIWYFKNL